MTKTSNDRIIDAQTAYDRTYNEIQSDFSDVIPIMDLIEKAIKRKQFYCHYSGEFNNYTEDKLNALGFTVNHIAGSISQREPDYWIISWDNPKQINGKYKVNI